MAVINRLPEIVYPLTQVNKVNEIVDVLNEAINSSYTEENPTLVPVEGVCTWTVAHNLGTQNVTCTIYEGDNLVISKVSILSENVVTVSLNSTSNITAGTYKIVVMAQGSVGSSGGGGDITVDSALSATSTNPVQNKVLYPSLSGFLPNGTVINVELDGSGDFNNLSDAIDYLTGKWSNGIVTIQLGAGTFDIASTITIDGLFFNISKLFIRGAGVSSTILNSTISSPDYMFSIVSSIVDFRNLTIKHSGGTQDTDFRGILFSDSEGSINTVNFEGLNNAVYARMCSHALFWGTTNFKSCGTAILSNASKISNNWQATTNFTDVKTALSVGSGGMINSYGWVINFSNVTNKTSQTVGSATNNGWITGITV